MVSSLTGFRLRFVLLLAGLLLAAFVVDADTSTPRIGYLVQSPLTDPPSPERAAFLDGLRTLGYENGRNIIIDYQSAEGDADKLLKKITVDDTSDLVPAFSTA